MLLLQSSRLKCVFFISGDAQREGVRIRAHCTRFVSVEERHKVTRCVCVWVGSERKEFTELAAIEMRLSMG
jgi:hypothetical protein